MIKMTFCRDQAIDLIVYDYHKGSSFPHKSLFDLKMDHSSSETASNTLQNVELFDLL